MATLIEIIEEKEMMKNPSDPVFFISDDELNEIEEILSELDGKKIYDPIKLFNRAKHLGYWCEGDYIGETGGFVFQKY